MCQICYSKHIMTGEEARKAAVEILFSDMDLTEQEEEHLIEVINEALKKIELETKNKGENNEY
jgi:hypothetical protein